MDEGAPRRQVYLAAPYYNDPQKGGALALAEAIKAAGFDLFADSDTEDPDRRLDEVKRSALLVAWLDGLVPQGVQIRALAEMQNQLNIPFPPQIQQCIDAGCQALGITAPSLAGKRQSIILPGQVEEQAGSPKGMAIQLGPQGCVAKVLSPAMNFGDASVYEEIGMAVAFEIPIVAVAALPPITGIHLSPSRALCVPSFEKFAEVMKVLSEAVLDSAGRLDVNPVIDRIEQVLVQEEKADVGGGETPQQ